MTISPELSGIVFGSIKHARMDEHRGRVDRLGMKRKNSRVLDVDGLPEGLKARVEPSDGEFIPGRRPKRRRIVRDHIREIAKDPRSLEFLKRVLLKGESIQNVAAELGIKYPTARAIESRGRRALGLPLRRKKKPKDKKSIDG